jgi:Flp pilus assembly pilin Flp
MATYRLQLTHSSVLIIVEAEMQQFLYKFWREEEGQDLIEYSLIITFIALACAAFLGGGSPAISSIWQVNNNHLQQASGIASGN